MSLARLAAAVGLLAVLAAGVAIHACTVRTDPPKLAGQDIRLTVLHTSDIHSRILPYTFVPNTFDRGYGLDPQLAPFGGLARMSAIIRRERARAARVLHLDSGDIFQGAPIFNRFGGEAEMRAVTAMRTDAMALGNHEFDRGAPNLVATMERWGGFELLAANYNFSDASDPQFNELSRVVKPYTIFNVDGLKVGVIGMGNITTIQSLFEASNSVQLRPLDTSQTIAWWAAFLRPQVDLVFVVSHLGLDEDESTALDPERAGRDENLQVASKDVDVIFGGHLHIVLNPPKRIPVKEKDADGNLVPTGHDVLVVHSGAFAKTVGRLDMVVHMPTTGEESQSVRARIVAYDYTVFPVTALERVNNDTCRAANDTSPLCSGCTRAAEGTNTCKAAVDGEVARVLEPYTLQMNMDLDLTRVFAWADVPLTSRILRNDPSGGDSQLGNLVATAMRIRPRVEADFSITNTLGIRADMDPGPITVEQMFNIFPFENTIVVMYLSGGEVKEMFDFVAKRSAERGCRTQAQIAGARFKLNCASPCDYEAGDANARKGCATEVQIEGACGDDLHRCWKDLNPFGSYRVAVNDYIANGGSGFTVLKRNTAKFNTGLSLRDALIDYLKDLPVTEQKEAYRCKDQLLPSGDATTGLLAILRERCPGATKVTECFGPISCLNPEVQAHDGRIKAVFE